MSEFVELTSYIDDEIARGRRVLDNVKRASQAAAPDGYDSGKIIPIVERYLEDLSRLQDNMKAKNAPRT